MLLVTVSLFFNFFFLLQRHRLLVGKAFSNSVVSLHQGGESGTKSGFFAFYFFGCFLRTIISISILNDSPMKFSSKCAFARDVFGIVPIDDESVCEYLRS